MLLKSKVHRNCIHNTFILLQFLVFSLTDSEDGSPAERHHHVLRFAGPGAGCARSCHSRASWLLVLTLQVDGNFLVYSASAGRCSQMLQGKKEEKDFPNDSLPCCFECSYKVKITDLKATSSACDEEAY